jgi:hypothetical protein
MSIKKYFISKQVLVDGHKSSLISRKETGLDLYDYIAQVINGGGSSAIITADNGLTVNPANNVILGGTLSTNTTINGAATASLAISNIDTAFTLQSNAVLQLTGNSSVNIKTPAVIATTANVGNLLMLTNATTGACEWQALTPNYTKGTAVQTGSVTNDVTLNQPAGMITTFTGSGTPVAPNTSITFSVLCATYCLITSQIQVSINNYAGTFGTNGYPVVTVENIINGKFNIRITNFHNTNDISKDLKIAFLIV